MTSENEWLTCDAPTLLLAHVRGTLSQRKDRLLAVAICSVMVDIILDARIRRALDVAEAYADGMASGDELRLAFCQSFDAVRDGARRGGWDNAEVLAAQAVTHCAAPDSRYVSMLTFHAVDAVTCGAEPDCSYISMLTVNRALPAAAYRETLNTDTTLFLQLIHDVVGNPFRPAVDVSWRSGTVTEIASEIYTQPAFERLPILADTLEDAGCTNQVVLDHLRSSGPHVRGCWALDLTLDKM